MGAFSVSDANVKATMFVIAYVKIGTQFVALPRVIVKETDGATEQVSFSYETGKVTFYYSSQTTAIGGIKSYAPQNDLTFSYVTIEKTVGQAMENAGVNLRSRTDVMTYLEQHQN
jgi:hypothetical protein